MIALIGVGLGTVSNAPAASGQGGSAATASAAREYRNPVLNRDFPDPDLIKAPNDWYYAYSTESDTTKGHVNIQVAKSRDLVHWNYRGDALPKLPSWGDQAGVSWAPDVARHGGRYFLYYSIVPNKMLRNFGLCLAVATSRSPAGPFVTTDKPLYCGPTLSDIDPNAFRNPKTGHWRVYWGSGGDMVTARLAPNMTSLVRPHAQPKLLLRGWSAKVRRPFEHGIEGPFVIARHGWYYLFYSGNRCCSYPPHYATMVARSRHVTGPFQRLAATRPGLGSVILRRNNRWAGPGHNTVIRDEAGQDWMFYHAIANRRPYLPGGNKAVRRVLLTDRIVYRNGWPSIARRSPSVGWKPAPVTR